MASNFQEYFFVEEPSDRLKCPICLEVAKIPKQHECGKVFCQKCIEKCGDKPCPSCKSGASVYFPDARAAQEIRDLPVKCNKFKDGCVWKGSIGTLSTHMQSCEFDLVVPCKYKYIGCEVKMKKRDIEKHQQQEDGHHLHLALQSVVVPTLSEGQSYVFELSDYTKKKQNNEVFISDPFYTHHKGYKMCVKVYANGTGSGTGSHLSASLCVIPGPYDKNLKWPFEGKIDLRVLNQSEHKNSIGIYVNAKPNSDNLIPGNCYCFEKFASQMTISRTNDQILYLKNDTLYFQVFVIVSSNLPWLKYDITRSATIEKLCKQAYREPVIFKVKDFADRKKNDTVYSYHMKTSYYGYVMRIQIYCSGTRRGIGSHVSVFVCITSGPCDQILSWPFTGTVKVELLNQLADNDHYKTTLKFTENDDIRVEGGLILEKFICHSELNYSDNRQFLMNDTLYFRVTALLGHSKPWLKCSDD